MPYPLLMSVACAALMAAAPLPAQAVPDAQFEPAFQVFMRASQGEESAIAQAVDSFAALLKAEKDPAAKPKADALREQQLRTLETLARDKAQREAMRQQGEAWRKADPSRAPAPVGRSSTCLQSRS